MYRLSLLRRMSDGIAIPDVFKALNTIRLYGEEDRAKNYYKKAAGNIGKSRRLRAVRSV